MSDEHQTPVVPSHVGAFLSGLSQALIPASIRVLDRLIGAAGEIPIAWLKQQTANIEAETESYRAVQRAIGTAAAAEASADKEVVSRAVNSLLRKEYRRQANKEAVAVAMIENLHFNPASEPLSGDTQPTSQGSVKPDDDWLNVFERYAGDASTPRMQELWGRVVAGEIRSPGKYSLRTLRYLSEFSQADGLRFEYCAKNAFSTFAPEKLLNYSKDKRLLLQLDSDGLVTAAEGSNVNHDRDFDSNGLIIIQEGKLAVVFRGAPNTKLRWAAFPLTPLGQELLGLIPGRDPRAAARKVAGAIRSTATKAADLAEIDADGKISVIENLWGDGSQGRN